MIALQLVGSPTSEFFFRLSMLYAKEVVRPDGFDLLFVIAYPDGNWSVTETLEEEIEKQTFEKVMGKVSNADIAVPHMFCEKGLVAIRLLFEDILKIPMVGSSGKIVALTQNKHLTKFICKSNEIDVPNGFSINSSNKDLKKIDYRFPCIVKPNNADNSDGLSLVNNKKELKRALDQAFLFDKEVLIEDYIPGREIRGAILEIDGEYRTLPFIEYLVHHAKPIRYGNDKLKLDNQGNLMSQSDKKEIPAECPAKLGDALKSKLSEMMIKAHKALGCRDFSMFDFRIHEKTNQPYFLETGLFWSFSEKSMISNMLNAENSNLLELTTQIWNQATKRKTE